MNCNYNGLLSEELKKSLTDFNNFVMELGTKYQRVANVNVEISSATPHREFKNEVDTSELDKEIERICKEMDRVGSKRNENLSEEEQEKISATIQRLDMELSDIHNKKNALLATSVATLGEYIRLNPNDMPKIVLYINNINAAGGNINWLLVQVYAHEMMHAYFDSDTSKPKNYTSFVEEPITELGMLNLMKEYDAKVPGIFDDALKNVKNKQQTVGCMHYGFGAYLYENELPVKYWIGIMLDGKYNALDSTLLDQYKKPFAQGKYPTNEQQHADWLEGLLDPMAIANPDLKVCKGSIDTIKKLNLGIPIPEPLSRRYDRCEEKEKRGVSSTAPYGGSWFNELTTTRRDSQSLIETMLNTANALEKSVSTTEPVALLGQIQAGKTRAFIGVIAKCFDLGFESILVMTQSNKALAQQTELRIRNAFNTHIGRELGVYNIIQNPKALSAWNANQQKNIVIAKKQKHNLNHTSKLLQSGGVLYGKKVLVIDDEADVIGVGYTKDSSGQVQKAILAELIDDLRNYAKSTCAYLEVTATPYALFLQSNEGAKNNNWQPLKPTQVFDMDLYKGYVGGEYFFNTAAKQVFRPVDNAEIKVLNEQLSRNKQKRNTAIRNAFTSQYISAFREALLSFLVAGAIRRCTEFDYRCAQLFNISTIQDKHARYAKFCDDIIEALKTCDSVTWDALLVPIFQNYAVVNVNWADVSKRLKTDLDSGAVRTIVVDSNPNTASIASLLDPNTGQLALNTPYSIFIGGEAIGRGVTIDHLISFYYVRNNKNQDTSIQHMRIFGNRSQDDLEVTRFYTSQEIFDKLRNMYSFDQDMRKQIKAGHQIIFLRKEGGKIIPCAPSKCLASEPEIIGPHHFLLPIGFDTKSDTGVGFQAVSDILSKISVYTTHTNNYPHYTIYHTTVDVLEQILREIGKSIVWHNAQSNYKWDLEGHLEAVKRCSPSQILLYVPIRQTNGGYSIRARFKADGVSPMDAPHDGQSDNVTCKRLATNVPVVMLLPQSPQKKDKWSYEEHFYWPVITMPGTCEEYVYCKD